MVHKLKIKQEYLENLLSGKKKAEIRINDRDYQVGDVLSFEKERFNLPVCGQTVSHFFLITHTHSGLGLEHGYVVLSVEKVKNILNKKDGVQE